MELLIEKYRPKTLDEIVLDQDSKNTILSWKESRTIPHLLLLGRPGIGKTSLMKIIIHDVLKCDMDYIYINASNENGIDTIRTKVMDFVTKASFDSPVKIVALDEVDYLTPSAQGALRNVMEEYSENSRFILTGNYRSKISEPIFSRCQTIDIVPSQKEYGMRCKYILDKEGIIYDKESLGLLFKEIKKYFPDLRRIIGEVIQKSSSSGTLIIKPKLHENEFIEELLKKIENNEKGYDIRKWYLGLVDKFSNDYNFLMTGIINHLAEREMDDGKKSNWAAITGEFMYRAMSGVDNELNFFSLILNLKNNN
jgi:replication factor C small subunit